MQLDWRGKAQKQQVHCFRKDLQVAACRALTQWVEKISEIFRVWTRQLKGLKL